MITYDELTGLLNRGSFMDKAEEAARAGENFVLINMDLDHFLQFNETYGHAGGDEWIRAVAKRFAEAFGETAVPGRYGGDEFMALVPGVEAYTVYQQAEALRQGIEQDPPEIVVNGETVKPVFTISMGVAAYPTSASDPNDLVDKAKAAMYRAKQDGGNHVILYQETDTLTGVMSRGAIMQALEEAVKAAQPTQPRGATQPLSLFALDVDRFKEINDEFGHRAGDEVLKRLGHILQANFKEVGQVGRIGGDEFIVVLPGQQADSAFILAEEVRRLIEDSEITTRMGAPETGERKFTLRFHISGGIATLPQDATDPVDLLRKADEALYRSKRTGRNRISLPASAQMVTKTSYYTQIQLEQLADFARQLDKTEAFLLREALDDLIRKYKRGG